MRLRYGTAVMWRADDVIQIGGDPDTSLVFTGLDAHERTWLMALAHTASIQLKDTIPPSDITPPKRAPLFLAQLQEKDMVQPEYPAQSALSLDIMTADPLILRALALLPAEKLTHVSVSDRRPVSRQHTQFFGAGFYGLPMHRAATFYLESQGIHLQATSAVPAITLVFGHRMVDPVLTSQLMSHDMAHLPIIHRENGTAIGPLVIPGTTPCCQCVMMHDRDSTPHSKLCDPEVLTAPLDELRTPVAWVTALEIARAVASLIDIPVWGPSPLLVFGAQMTINRYGVVTVRHVMAHPACGCGADGSPFDEHQGDTHA